MTEDDVTEDDVKIQPVETHKYLFTTSTCPNCRMAKKILEGENLEIIDAEENPDMARAFGVMQAPTLVVTDGEHTKKYVNASNIQKYVDEEGDAGSHSCCYRRGAYEEVCKCLQYPKICR